MILVYPFYLLFFIVIFKILKIKPKFIVSILILILPWSGFLGSKIITNYYCNYKADNEKVDIYIKNIQKRNLETNYIEKTINIEFPIFLRYFVKGEEVQIFNEKGELIYSITKIIDPYNYPFMNTGTGEMFFQDKKICEIVRYY